MTRSCRNTLPLALVFLVHLQTCLGQIDPWERLRSDWPGKKVTVQLNSGFQVTGKIKDCSPDVLRLADGNRIIALPKSDIATVVRTTGMPRWQKALYGSVMLLGGAGASAYWGCRCCTPCDTQRNARAADIGAGIVAITGLAMLVWTIFPQGKEVIYLSSPPGGAAR